MTETRKDPKYIRIVGLTLLAALLVVASCGVDQPPTTAATSGSSEGDERMVVPRTEAFEVGQDLEVPLPNAAADPPAVLGQQSNLRLASQQVSDEERIARIRNAMAEQEAETRAFIEELQALRAASQRAAEALAEAQAQAVPQELRPEDRAAIQAGPVFTPMTVVPEILNRAEIVRALTRLYPAILRDNGIGGTVEVWFFISEEGTVLVSRISVPSPHEQLNQAALEVANIFRFSPALNRETIVEVWIQLPITFEVAN